MADLGNKCCIPFAGIGCTQCYTEADTEVDGCNALWIDRNCGSDGGFCVFCGVCNDGAHACNHVCRIDGRYNDDRRVCDGLCSQWQQQG
mgnify:CR=1 FL=1